jgi:1-acyl-sn-glycerol-3-phosphate acyltransferase
MYYKEDLGYVYPDRSDEHMISVKRVREIKFDVNYNYYDKTIWNKFKRGVLWVLLNTIVFPLCTCLHGLKIEGKENFKKNKHLFKNGGISICNHVFLWDYLCVLKAIRPNLQYLIAWKDNLEGPSGPLIRLVGGIPVPTNDIRAMMKFNAAISDVLNDGKWLHVFPEGSMWYFYPDIRPFKQTVFKLAVKHNKAIIPMGYSYREPKGLFKIWKRRPCVTLNIGEPIFPNESLPVAERINELQKVCYIKVQELVGIKPGDPTYNENQDIDTYQKTM